MLVESAMTRAIDLAHAADAEHVDDLVLAEEDGAGLELVDVRAERIAAGKQLLLAPQVRQAKALFMTSNLYLTIILLAICLDVVLGK